MTISAHDVEPGSEHGTCDESGLNVGGAAASKIATKVAFPCIGSHLSVAGGMHLAVNEAVRLGLGCVQVFTKNQQQWRVPELGADSIVAWKRAMHTAGWSGPEVPAWEDGGMQRSVSHASYLINLASPNDELWRKSIELMVCEITRCDALGIGLLVHHPGSSTTSPKADGIERIAAAYVELIKRTKHCRVVSCLEATVGAGATIGGSFEELGTLRQRIVELTGAGQRVGLCIDTCHIHAAGYAMDSAVAVGGIIAAMDREFGLEHIRCLHINDSKMPAGSRKDRHEHIGLGTIAPEAFGALLAHPVLGRLPAIMETPKEGELGGLECDLANSAKLRELVTGAMSGQ